MEEKLQTGYPSVDKPWLKYYTEEQIHAPLPHMTAYEYLKQQNAERLDYLAIDSEMGCYTYGELFAQIDATAKALWAMGIHKGKNVLSMFPVLPHESFLFYGIDAVGAALCQISPMYTAAEACNFANRIDADLFFVFDFILTPEMERMVYENTQIRHIVVVNVMPLTGRDERTIAWDTFIAMGRDVTLPEIHRDPAKDVLFFASSGGSTGEPRCVMLTDNCFNIAVHQYLNFDLGYFPSDKWLRLWPIFSASASCANHHMPLCAGMQMLLRALSMDMSNFDRMVLNDKPNHLMLIPQLLDFLDQSPLIHDQDLSFIRSAGCGGMAITPQFEDRAKLFFQKHNINAFLGYGWGCTESCTIASNRNEKKSNVMGSAGIPMLNTIVSSFDVETGNELPFDTEGELCIDAPTIMLGYYHDEDATKKVLRLHADGKRWLHTGDLGKINRDGVVTVSGRMTRTIFVASAAKVYPQQLESEISQVAGVKDVVVCAVPDLDADGFFAPVCFIVPENMADAEAVKTAVEEFCTMKFPEDSRPKRVFIKDHMPLNKGNKPDILRLEKEAAEAMG